MGSLGGAPRPRKDIKGAQRSTQVGQKSTEECKSKSWPHVIPHTKESRDESRV